MVNFKNTVENAVNVLKAGGMIILVDDEHRENEGDLVAAAELITPEAINFMAKNGRGLICLPMSADLTDKLALPMMTNDNRSPYKTAFTVSIEAASGVQTGISAADRSHTIKTALADAVTPQDIVSPGHVFPLKARKKGVLERRGQTEGSVDLMKIAGLKHAAVICEIMNEDGSMSRMAQLEKIAEQYHLPIITIQDIFNYRVSTETLIYEEISAHIPMEKFRDFEMLLFKNDFDDLEHFVLYKKLINPQQPPLVRIHSECVTGDLFGSLRCDCGKQLEQALQMIDAEGGVLIYLRQEGRGIGLSNKLKAYALQDTGLDTVEANIELGLPVDNREYHLAYQFLKHLGYQTIRLITNNPLKIEALEFFGVKVAERISLVVQTNPDNQKYIDTKIQKLGHLINKD